MLHIVQNSTRGTWRKETRVFRGRCVFSTRGISQDIKWVCTCYQSCSRDDHLRGRLHLQGNLQQSPAMLRIIHYQLAPRTLWLGMPKWNRLEENRVKWLIDQFQCKIHLFQKSKTPHGVWLFDHCYCLIFMEVLMEGWIFLSLTSKLQYVM